MASKKIRYIEHCDTADCSTKRPTFEKTKGGFTCYRCNRKKTRAEKFKK